jgi:hypothetical protein
VLDVQVVLPHDIFEPKEAARERVGDHHVFGCEVVELVFVGVSGFAVRL